MEKILLAVDGSSPTEKILKYAFGLCKRIKAELNILHVMKDSKCVKYLEANRQRMKQLGKMFETAQMASTFAQAGEHEYAGLIIEKEKQRIKRLSKKAKVGCVLTFKTGQSDEEIVKYVRDNPDVVLTIFDPAEPENGKNDAKTLDCIRNNISIPLVTVGTK